MVDKIRPLKIESAATGGDETDYLPTEVNPSEDYVASKGIALEGLDTHLIDKGAGGIQFTDPVAGTRSVNQLRTAVENSFDNSTNGFTSTDVQHAIEEGLTEAINNDSWSFIASYNGNAGVGRYLEIFPGYSSDEAPVIFPDPTVLKAVSLGVSAASTGTIGFFKTSDLVNPIYSISLANETRKMVTGITGVSLDALDELAIQVTSGSFNKPFMRVWGRKEPTP